MEDEDDKEMMVAVRVRPWLLWWRAGSMGQSGSTWVTVGWTSCGTSPVYGSRF
jgi:hypothetical protein